MKKKTKTRKKTIKQPSSPPIIQQKNTPPFSMKKNVFLGIVILTGMTILFSGKESLLVSRIEPFLLELFGEQYPTVWGFLTIWALFSLIKQKILGGKYAIVWINIFCISLVSLTHVFSSHANNSVYNVFPGMELFFGTIPTVLLFFIGILISVLSLFEISPYILLHMIERSIHTVTKQILFLFSHENSTPSYNINETKEKQNTQEYMEPQKDLNHKKQHQEIIHTPPPSPPNISPKKEENTSYTPIQKIPIKTKEPIKETKIGNIPEQKSDTKMLIQHTPTTKKEQEKKELSTFSWKFPELSLLKSNTKHHEINHTFIQMKQQEIIEKLRQFGIEVTMKEYKVGPTVTQFRLFPHEGVKLNRIEGLKKDLALALQAKSIRIQAPIPGQGVVGIEVPNEERIPVLLKEVLIQEEFLHKKHKIPLCIGKNVSGEIIVGDLSKMPHLLVAGQTASGKSVGMNGFILSLLYAFSPKELRMIMIDPKRVELSIYNGIPHLLTPVIIDPQKALNSLKWVIKEMLQRYELASQKKARNIQEYNQRVENTKKLPYIIVFVDELADLMMSGNKKEVETSIARIAQMGRAAGIHLIIATQRPSVDVITGIIKANIPSRIAFTVASQIDSRTIIDRAGAEDLLGSGDMLYFPTGALEPERVQGVYVSTEEVEDVVNFIKLHNTMDSGNIFQEEEQEASELHHTLSFGTYEEDPEIIEKAIQIVKEAKKGSTSLLQRKLGLGYSRAAKILDILEELGVVGPSNGSKPREVYETS